MVTCAALVWAGDIAKLAVCVLACVLVYIRLSPGARPFWGTLPAEGGGRRALERLLTESGSTHPVASRIFLKE